MSPYILGGRRMAPDGTPARNPAFDLTPYPLISAIVTEDTLSSVFVLVPTGKSNRAGAEVFSLSRRELRTGTSDVTDVEILSGLAEGDLVAFRSAGAYGAVMASEYNTRPLVPEVLVHGDHFAVIRERPTFDEILNRDTIPPWL